MVLNLAVVGLGRWGKVLVDSVQDKSSVVRFGKAVTRDPVGATAYCAVRGIAPIGSFANALSDLAIDGIVLATPHSHLSRQVIDCAVGLKLVFVKKTFAHRCSGCWCSGRGLQDFIL